MCRGIYSAVAGVAETEGRVIFVPLVLWCTLAREEQENHVKLERRGELKKRREPLKGKRNMGSLNASFTLHLGLPWQHLLRHGVEGWH